MKDEKYDVSQFRQVKSFFRDSWVEVPDRISESRIMRPRFVMRDPEKDADEEEDKTDKKEASSSMTKKGDSKRNEKGKGGKERTGKEQVDGEEEKPGETKEEMKQEGEKKAQDFIAASAIYVSKHFSSFLFTII